MNGLVPASVPIPAKNEEKNIGPCFVVLHGWADEVVAAGSQSSVRMAAIAKSYAATVVQFKYQGGWPNKRQAALDTNLLLAVAVLDRHFDPTGPHIRFLTQKSLCRLLSENGFCVKSVGHLGRFWPVWMNMVVHGRKR